MQWVSSADKLKHDSDSHIKNALSLYGAVRFLVSPGVV